MYYTCHFPFGYFSAQPSRAGTLFLHDSHFQCNEKLTKQLENQKMETKIRMKLTWVSFGRGCQRLTSLPDEVQLVDCDLGDLPYVPRKKTVGKPQLDRSIRPPNVNRHESDS